MVAEVDVHVQKTRTKGFVKLAVSVERRVLPIKRESSHHQ